MYLYENYGLMALEIAKGDLNPIVGPITKAELEWIVKNEMVTEIEDVLLRRTRSTFLMSKQQTLALIPVIAEIFRKQHKLSHSAYKELIDKTTRNILMYDFD